MNTEIRVMLCDDSAIIRRLIKSAIRLEPALKVVCEAVHGKDAVEKLEEARPDVVVMDVEMPVLDGVEATREIRKREPTLPIIMFSSLTSRGAEASMDAIAAGANDFATKPTGAGHIQQAMESLRRDLIPKIIHWTSRKRSSAMASTARSTASAARQSTVRAAGVDSEMDMNEVVASAAAMACDASTVATKTIAAPASLSSDNQTAATPQGGPTGNSLVATGDVGKISAIGIGVSTGGPQALATLFKEIPKGCPVPILIAQHMPPVFTGLLAERLSSQTGHAIREAVDGDELTAGKILVAPGDFHLTVVRDGTVMKARLTKDPPENSCRPSVDPLFRSMAQTYGRQALGIVLTGMGQDGAIGAQSLKESGARILVQDEASSVVWGMPGQVAKQGLADRILPINQMGAEVFRIVNASLRKTVAASSN